MNPYFNFVFVSRQDRDAEKIISEIERNKLYKIERVETAEASIERLRRGNLHCVLFNFDSFTFERVKLITTVRDSGFPYPTIVFANHTGKDILDIIQKMPRVVIIEKPFESKDVWGICQKLLQGQKVNQRIFRRYYTSQSAAIEKTATGETLSAHIFNLSRGGAYLELGTGRVQPGDMLKMSISLDKLSRNYNVDAEVIWSTRQGFTKGWPAAGVRFVKPDEVYRNLLNKL